jgi:hypothetical protein
LIATATDLCGDKTVELNHPLHHQIDFEARSAEQKPHGGLLAVGERRGENDACGNLLKATAVTSNMSKPKRRSLGGVIVGGLMMISFVPSPASPGATGVVPLPRERPRVSDEQSVTPDLQWSACDERLAELAQFKPLPLITGPGECMASDVVLLEDIQLPNNAHVSAAPPATLRCSMAEAVAHWVRDDIAPAIAALGTSMRNIETADSFDCRERNGIAGAKISEHGRANALDVRAFKLANRATIELNNPKESKSLRERFRDSACARFSTVLGNGADAYHENHVHLDLIQRSHNYRICQWDVLDEAETAARAAAKAAQASQAPNSGAEPGPIPLPRPRPQINPEAPAPQRHARASARGR